MKLIFLESVNTIDYSRAVNLDFITHFDLPLKITQAHRDLYCYRIAAHVVPVSSSSEGAFSFMYNLIIS